MIEESKYFSDMIKKHFNKKLLMIRKDDEDFKNSSKCWICDNSYVGGDVKEVIVISLENRGLAHRDCNIKVKLNYKIPIVLLI